MASSNYWHVRRLVAAGCCAGALSVCSSAASSLAGGESSSSSLKSEGIQTASVKPAAAAEARVVFPRLTREWSSPGSGGGPFAAAQSAAAEHLRRDGCVVLCSADCNGKLKGNGKSRVPSGLMAGLDREWSRSNADDDDDDEDAHSAQLIREGAEYGAASEHHQLLLDRATARACLDLLLAEVAAATGKDPREEQFEFVEVYHRSRLRYDVSSPPVVTTPAFSDLLDSLVVPVIAQAYLTPGTTTTTREHKHSGTPFPSSNGDANSDVASSSSLSSSSSSSPPTPLPSSSPSPASSSPSSSSSSSAEAAAASSAAQSEAEAQVKTLCEGVVTSLPGAPAQQFHADGPRGIVTVFVPLVDCEVTGTEFWLRSHASDLAQAVAATGALDDSCPRWISGFVRRLCEAAGVGGAFASPRLRRGDVLIFDYKIIHRGRAHPLDHRHHHQHHRPCHNRKGIDDGDDAAEEREEQDGIIIAESSSAADANEQSGGGCDRPILYRTFFWGGDAEGVHEGPGGLNWPTRRLSDERSDDERGTKQ